MTALLQRLHARLGDFWWYSLMIFVAARAADCLNVFVGLWLVPKYVPPSELGAVMPLTNFAGFLAIPIGVFASTFRQELSNLAKARMLCEGAFEPPIASDFETVTDQRAIAGTQSDLLATRSLLAVLNTLLFFPIEYFGNRNSFYDQITASPEHTS